MAARFGGNVQWRDEVAAEEDKLEVINSVEIRKRICCHVAAVAGSRWPMAVS
jgi:hypothetical protein